MQSDPLHGRQHEYDEKEQKERNRRGECNLAYPRARIEFARHDHPDFGPRKQAGVLPLQLPTGGVLGLLCWREAALRKIDLVEICPHRQREVFDLAHLGAKVITPFVHPLRSVPDFNDLRLPRREPDLVAEDAGFERQIWRFLAADYESEIVVNAALIRRRKIEKDVALGVGIVGHAVLAVEKYAIDRIPEQPLLAVFQVQVCCDVAGFEQQRMIDRFVFGLGDSLSALGGFDPGLLDCLVIDLRRQLPLLCSPELSYGGFQTLVLSRRTSHHRGAQGGPGSGNAEKDEDDGRHSREHSSS